MQENASSIEQISAALGALSTRPYRLGILLESNYEPETMTNGVHSLRDMDARRYELLDHANKCTPRPRRVRFYLAFVYLTSVSQDPSMKFSRNSQVDVKTLKAKMQLNWHETERRLELRHWRDSTGANLFSSFDEFKIDFLTRMIKSSLGDDEKKQPARNVDWNDQALWGEPCREEFYFEPIVNPPTPPLKVLYFSKSLKKIC